MTALIIYIYVYFMDKFVMKLEGNQRSQASINRN